MTRPVVPVGKPRVAHANKRLRKSWEGRIIPRPKEAKTIYLTTQRPERMGRQQVNCIRCEDRGCALCKG